MEELKEKIEEIVNKVKSDENFAEKFKTEPVKAVEEILGVDLPDEQINQVIDAVKAKLNLDESGIIDKVKGLFNKD